MVPLVYAELRRLARGYMRGEREGHTLQTTALINEAFLRLTDWKNVSWQNRAHFFGVSAQLMGRILVNSDSTWAGLLLWCRLQGFAKSAHPWLISSHPFGVEEFRPIGGAEYVIERRGHFKFQIRKGAALCHGDREGKRRLK